MENHASNPAGRLWLFYTRLTSHPDPNTSVQQLASEYFGSAGIDERFMSGIAGLMRLPEEVEAMVTQLGDGAPLPAPKLLRPLQAVRDAHRMDPICANPVHWYGSLIDGAVRSELETTSHVLDKFVVRAPDIDPDTLSSIRSLADEIIALAQRDTSLDAVARAAFIQFARRIVSSVDLYQVTGPQALVDELDRFYSVHRRIKPKSGEALKNKLSKLVGAIVIATELFTMPANVANAIDEYEDLFALSAITEAPASDTADQGVILAEIEGGLDDPTV